VQKLGNLSDQMRMVSQRLNAHVVFGLRVEMGLGE
jgi:hypothetical protein